FEQQQPPNSLAPAVGPDTKGAKAFVPLLAKTDNFPLQPRDQKTYAVRAVPKVFEQIALRMAIPVPAKMLDEKRHQVRDVSRGDGSDCQPILRFALQQHLPDVLGNLEIGEVGPHADRMIQRPEAEFAFQKGDCFGISVSVDA